MGPFYVEDHISVPKKWQFWALLQINFLYHPYIHTQPEKYYHMSLSTALYLVRYMPEGPSVLNANS